MKEGGYGRIAHPRWVYVRSRVPCILDVFLRYVKRSVIPLWCLSFALAEQFEGAHVCALSDIALDLSQYKRLRFPLLYGDPASKKRWFVTPSTPLYIPSQLHSILQNIIVPALFVVIRMQSVLFLHFYNWYCIIDIYMYI